MKNICIIAGSFADDLKLQPLKNEILADPETFLSVISTETNQAREMDITYSRLEQDGILVEENTDVKFHSGSGFFIQGKQGFEQKEYERLLAMIEPDLVVIYGNAYQSYLAAVCACLLDIPVAHIEGGTGSFGTWEGSYSCGISKLSQLHFTSSEKYRQQVIRFGEHPDTVFNVGSLQMENIRKLVLPSESQFIAASGIPSDKPFAFVTLESCLDAGSRNAELIAEILTTIDQPEFSDVNFVFSPLNNSGFGMILNEIIQKYVQRNPEKAILLPSSDISHFGCAVKYSKAVITNYLEGRVMASSFGIPCAYLPTEDYLQVLEAFNSSGWRQPFFRRIQKSLNGHDTAQMADELSLCERAFTARTIKDIIKLFHLSDIRQKDYYRT